MYDNPTTITYSFGLVDFGAADIASSIKGPPGAKGILRDISVSASEVFAGATSTARIDIGSTPAGAEYASFELGTTAATDAVSAANTDYTDRILPADTQVELTFVAAVGTPTGQGYTNITIDWDLANPGLNTG